MKSIFIWKVSVVDMKTGLVLEGGAMRGMYTAGVLDVMMENGIKVDGAVGVSAGAVFGCNYKSGQIGRVIRYNTKYCRDPRYSSLGTLIKTGDLYGVDFCYHMIPEILDPFDQKAYEENPMDFYVVCTDVHTGRPIYHLCNKGDDNDILWMRASASMPIVSKVVSVDGYDLLDGGISDSIPVSWFMRQGYDKSIVILTRHDGYRKKKSKFTPVIRALMKKYPAIGKAMEQRHLKYNASISKVRKLERQGKVFVIQPSSKIPIGRTEKDPEKLRMVYDMGRKDALSQLKKMKDFLENEDN